jgi:hypothetical protein
MKKQPPKKPQNDPSIKGNMSAEDIVRADWKRNYEKLGVPLLDFKQMIKEHVEQGGQVVRLRNTLFLLTMEQGGYEAEFQVITADLNDVYATMFQLFGLSLAKSRNVESMFTFTDDKKMVDMALKIFGKDNTRLEESDVEDDYKYKLTIDIGNYYSSGQKSAEAQAKE